MFVSKIHYLIIGTTHLILNTPMINRQSTKISQCSQDTQHLVISWPSHAATLCYPPDYLATPGLYPGPTSCTRQWPDLLPLQDSDGVAGPVPHRHRQWAGCKIATHTLQVSRFLFTDCWCSQADMCCPALSPWYWVWCHDICK